MEFGSNFLVSYTITTRWNSRIASSGKDRPVKLEIAKKNYSRWTIGEISDGSGLKIAGVCSTALAILKWRQVKSVKLSLSYSTYRLSGHIWSIWLIFFGEKLPRTAAPTFHLGLQDGRVCCWCLTHRRCSAAARPYEAGLRCFAWTNDRRVLCGGEGWNDDISSVQNHCWLMIVGDYTTQ